MMFKPQSLSLPDWDINKNVFNVKYLVKILTL